MDKERFLVPAHGPDHKALAVALVALKTLCEKHDSNGLICVPALKHAPGTILSQIWPEQHIKLLANGKALKISEHHTVSMCSQTTLKNHLSSPVILALFASKEMIEKVESAWGCKALIVVPWISEDSASWEQKYAPKLFFTSAAPG